MKPDVIVSWPRNCDYPLWRLFIHENRREFGDVIVIFTETYHGPDFRDFVVNAMAADNVICRNSPTPQSGEDWRNVAVNFGLSFSHSDLVWFTEQDFYVLGGFFDEVDLYLSEGAEAIGVYQGDRLHPCSIFITKDLLKRLVLDFGVEPNVGDHFWKIQAQLGIFEKKVWAIPEKFYEHFNGLSHNWRLGFDGEIPNHKTEEFYKYLEQCLEAPVDLSSEWVTIANKIISARKKGENISENPCKDTEANPKQYSLN